MTGIQTQVLTVVGPAPYPTILSVMFHSFHIWTGLKQTLTQVDISFWVIVSLYRLLSL